ncbi:MAG: fatty acid desaturase, partial [Deltaproteobacteria bacterium]|nr:fatty acid desaturase [Deltaproteobacteria bacterium]
MTEPRTGRALILATKPFEQESIARSWVEVVATIALFGAAVAVVFSDTRLLFKASAAVFAGFVQFRLFALYHEHVHGAVLAHSKPARRLFSGIGMFMLVPRRAWKETHAFHHRHNGKLEWTSVGSYPVLTTEQLAAATPRERLAYRIRRHPLAIIGGYMTVGIAGMCVQAFRRMPKRHWGGPVALGIHAVGFVALTWAFGPVVALLAWVVPVFVNHAIAAYLFYAQHNFPETHFYDRDSWDYTDAALHGSSFMEMGPVMQWLTANVGYHHVHHLNPKIPFYRLPQAMAALQELQSPHRTSWNPSDVAACLRLHVWDAKAGRMRTTASTESSPNEDATTTG